MDAFEKLAELVGASVEASPSQWLPRTRAEALALGLPRYFTGKPCKHGHVAERLAAGACSECLRQYTYSGDKAEYARQYRAAPGHKERVAEWRRGRLATPEGRALNREKERLKAMRRAGDAALYAINQAEYAARSAIAPADIVPQCPEPHRSQLQALVDRIRADPTAGKAVVGLLRTMRELRKAELAEMREPSTDPL